MKKTLSLLVALVMVFALAAPALAVYTGIQEDEYADGEVRTTSLGGLPENATFYGRDEDFAGFSGDEGFGLDEIAAAYNESFTVNGEAVDVSGIPGAPSGYVPMRRFCEAVGDYVDWYKEDNEAFFTVCGVGVVVNFTTMTVTVDFETTDLAVYLDPAGYTFLDIYELAGYIDDLTVEPELVGGVLRHHISTEPNRSELEKLAYTIVDTTGLGSVMSMVGEDAYLEGMGLNMDNYIEVVPLYPMMSANPSMVMIAEVEAEKVEAAKADFAAFRESLMANMGNYPSSAALIEAGEIVIAPDGAHIMLVISDGKNADAISMFNAAFSPRER